ncbi:MAG: 2-oxo acid dehydrogenase subunit E2 [Chthonomonadales bacterium]|nr:2-oxo acid dehydrogenase subunit E2 [Chthonomonadales bacterium]
MAEVRMPKMGDGMEEGTILRWLKRDGDTVAVEEPIAEIETDKANVEIPAEEAGVLARIVVPEGETVPVGAVIAYIGAVEGEVDRSEPAASASATAAKAEPVPVIVREGPSPGGAPQDLPREPALRVRASPLAKSVARRLGVDITQVRGTGGGVGRVVARDVLAFHEASAPRPTAPVPPPAPPRPQPAFVAKPSSDIEITKMRRAIARRTVQSKQTIPHFYLVTPVDMERALDTLTQLNARYPDGKVTVNDLVVKACAVALVKFSDVNVSFTPEERIRKHGSVNIGIAVGTEDGLRIPVVTDCEQRDLRDISAEAKKLIARTRSGAITPQEMSGATFTVSNLGMFGIEEFAAIISPPESAILAVGAVAPEVLVDERGGFVARRRMRITLSCDHRTVDGLLGAQFLQEVRRLLENPVELLTG